MKIKEVKVKEGTEAYVYKRSTTAGLTSGYQRTSNTSMSVSAAETTGGLFLIDIFNLPVFVTLDKLSSDVVIPNPVEEMIEGYREMATKNSLLAEGFLPLAPESWPNWEE